MELTDGCLYGHPLEVYNQLLKHKHILSNDRFELDKWKMSNELKIDDDILES